MNITTSQLYWKLYSKQILFLNYLISHVYYALSPEELKIITDALTNGYYSREESAANTFNNLGLRYGAMYLLHTKYTHCMK